MTIFSELFSDLRYNIEQRTTLMPEHKERNRHAPQIGDLAPDFTLFDTTGTQSVTLSDFRGDRPVALVFGSFT